MVSIHVQSNSANDNFKMCTRELCLDVIVDHCFFLPECYYFSHKQKNVTLSYSFVCQHPVLFGTFVHHHRRSSGGFCELNPSTA